MSTCRDILLEIKRRLGDTNAPVPGEVDMMAFLNKALRGMWNYGAMLVSPVLQSIDRFQGTGHTLTLPEQTIRIRSVYDHALNRNIYPVSPMYGMLNDTLDTKRRFRFLGDRIELYPQDDSEQFDLSVCRIPEFVPLKLRSDDLPFPSHLDGMVVEWTLAIASKKDAELSDVSPGQLPQGNMLTEYFRGGARLLTGRGPW